MKSLKLICLIGCVLLIPMSNMLGQSPSKIENRKQFVNQITNKPTQKLGSLLSGYTFTKTTGTYSNLTGTISINEGELWDDFEGVISIGFDFDLFDTTIDSLFFGIGVGGLVSTAIDENFETDLLIVPFEADLIDRGDLSGTSISPISYKLDGQVGNRILKLEWKNAGFYSEGDELGTLNDFVNFQLWLYEGSNNIEMRYGPNKITNPSINYASESGPIVGLTDYGFSNTFLLSGNPSNPIVTDSLVFLTGTPPNGTIYKFSKMVSSTNNDNQKVAAKISPNPFHVSGVINLKNRNLKNGVLKITDINGRLVKTMTNLQSDEITIQRDNLVNGVYFYTLTDKTKFIESGKFMIE